MSRTRACGPPCARHILETSRAQGGPQARVRDIATADYPTKAQRPVNSRLSTAKFASTFGWKAPQWRQSAELVVCLILGRNSNISHTDILNDSWLHRS